MKSAMQLKAMIKNMTMKTGIKANALLQNYMLERLLERISVSEYKWNFILKGGMLISAMIGLGSRTTMDMDTTMKGIEFSKENLMNIFEKIIAIQIKDDIRFILKGIEEIRKDDDYGGYRISLEAIFDKIVVPIKVDLSTGDVITPKEIDFDFSLMFEDRKIEIPAYNIETILAEKYETIISRGILNTRARDFYDVYILANLYWEEFSNSEFKRALDSTASKRGTVEKMRKSRSVLEELRLDNNIKKIWDAYSKKFDYANGIEFEDTLVSIEKLSTLL